MSGLDAAAERLAQLEASDTGEMPNLPAQQEQREDGSVQRAGAGKGTDAQAQKTETTDTRAEAAKPKTEDEGSKIEDVKKPDAGGKPDEGTKAEEPAKSRYAKSQERLAKTWDEVNKRKDQLSAQQQQLQQREQEIARREQDFETRRKQASQPQYKPEDYERASQARADRARALHQQADGIEAAAQKAEDAGDYTKAAGLREQAKHVRRGAYKEEGNAEDLKAHADNLRRNPPPTPEAEDQKLEAARKEWTQKAAVDFPDLVKKDSELQKAVAQHLNHLWNTDRALASHPQIIYHATRLAAAETAAARVPALQKELGELKAKLKDLEETTAPASTASAQRVATGGPKGDDEERAELQQLAQEMGSLR